MPHIDRTLRVDAGPQQLWDVVADPLRFGEWLTLHRSWQGAVPPTFVAGSQVTAVVAVLNIPATITWTVERYDAPEAVRLRGTGVAGIEVAIALDVRAAGDGGSELTLGVDFDGQLVSGALGPAIENAGRVELDRSLDRLRGLLGPDAPDGASPS